MKNDKVLEVMEGLDTNFIEEAEKYQGKHKSNYWIKVPIAAGLVILVGISLYVGIKLQGGKGDTGNNNNRPIQHEFVEAKVVSFDTLAEMEASSELIIKCVREEEEETEIKKSFGSVSSACTFSKVKIENVYKDTSNNINAGEEITIRENAALDSASNTMYHVAGYQMMKPNESYLLFLTAHKKANGDTYYSARGINFGTIPLREGGNLSLNGNNNMDNTKDEYSVGGPVDFSHFIAIWDAAKRKYIMESLVDTEGFSEKQKALLEKYPEYFTLDAGKGLDVYVAQFAANSYSFKIWEHGDEHDFADELRHGSLKADEVKIILKTYKVNPAEVNIIPYQDMLSSYINPIWINYPDDTEESKEKRRQEYIDTVRKLLEE